MQRQEIALERGRKIATLRLIEARGRHDHARRAESALKALSIEEGLLHRVQAAIG